MSPLPEPEVWLIYILMGLVVALLVSAAIGYVLGRFIGSADCPTPDEQAEDERGIDSMRARLQHDKANPLDDIVDHRGMWWGPRP